MQTNFIFILVDLFVNINLENYCLNRKKKWKIALFSQFTLNELSITVLKKSCTEFIRPNLYLKSNRLT